MDKSANDLRMELETMKNDLLDQTCKLATDTAWVALVAIVLSGGAFILSIVALIRSHHG